VKLIGSSRPWLEPIYEKQEKNPSANNTAAARRPAAAGLLGVRYARVARFAHPHCARPRILEYSDSLLWAGATSACQGSSYSPTLGQHIPPGDLSVILA